MLVIEQISTNVQHGGPIDLVKDCNAALTYLVGYRKPHIAQHLTILQRHKSRKSPSRALLREIETQIDKIEIIDYRMQNAAWVAQRFAKEQQMKDEVDDEEDDVADEDEYSYTDSSDSNVRFTVHHHASHPRAPRRGSGPSHGNYGRGGRYSRPGQQYQYASTNQPSRKYYSDRYAREDEQVRSMKFGEEIGTRCCNKLRERSKELDKLSRELRELSGQVNSLVDIKAEDHGQAILTASYASSTNCGMLMVAV